MIALSSANKCPPIDSVRELSIDIATHLSPPNPPTARDIETDGIFTKNAETGINNIVFDDQGDEDWDRILALSHPKVNIQSNHKLLLS